MEIHDDKITIDSYNKTAEEYFKIVSSFEVLPELHTFMKLVKKNGRILDLGCGPGHHAKLFHENGFDVVGVDLSSKMIKIAQNQIPDIEFRVMDIQDLNFMYNSFDGIWASASLLHISKSKIRPVLSKLYNILRKKGVFYLSLKKGRGSKFVKDYRYKGVSKYYSYYSEVQIEKLILESGFSLIESSERDKRDIYDTNPWIHIFCKKP